MNRLEMVEKLRENFNITIEEARDVLERNNWDLLDACVELEKSGKMKADQEAAAEYNETKEAEETSENGEKTAKKNHNGRKICDAARNVLRMGIDNRLVVTRNEEVVIKVPVIVPAICGLSAFWLTASAGIVGLVFGAKYSFEGKELGKEKINETMEKASETANNFMKNVANRANKQDAEAAEEAVEEAEEINETEAATEEVVEETEA